MGFMQIQAQGKKTRSVQHQTRLDPATLNACYNTTLFVPGLWTTLGS